MEWLLAGIIFSGKLAIGTASTFKYVFFFQSNDWVSCSKQSSSKWLLNNAECSEGSYLSLSLNQPIFFLFSFFTLTGSFENRKRHVFKLPVSWPLLPTYHSLVSHWNKGSHTIVAATFSHPYLRNPNPLEKVVTLEVLCITYMLFLTSICVLKCMITYLTIACLFKFSLLFKVPCIIISEMTSACLPSMRT